MRKKILFPEEPIPIKSSQFSDLNITSKIIEELNIKELTYPHFKTLMDFDKNIWIISFDKIVRFDGSYFHVYNLIENFGFEYINPETAVIDSKGNIWFGTKNQILNFDGSKLTCINNVYDSYIKKTRNDGYLISRYDYAQIKKIICHKNEVFFTSNDKKPITNIFKYSNDKLFKIVTDSSHFLNLIQD